MLLWLWGWQEGLQLRCVSLHHSDLQNLTCSRITHLFVCKPAFRNVQIQTRLLGGPIDHWECCKVYPWSCFHYSMVCSNTFIFIFPLQSWCAPILGLLNTLVGGRLGRVGKIGNCSRTQFMIFLDPPPPPPCPTPQTALHCRTFSYLLTAPTC